MVGHIRGGHCAQGCHHRISIQDFDDESIGLKKSGNGGRRFP
ncbi:hypothetical protein A11S_202 [Micavibrio aeruginosavorus EPB]|uniref:Uncharacterized protein n=1 Tax=Micavibrio aeruginosavorus EPB TaxID=349215 RepID=M4VCV8_9BACT|nr:hypothetical protein A11S_202 [Micavibrio aeruginosavorus EPB]